MTYTYETKGTCSRSIDIEIDDDRRLQNVRFLGGCNGNLQGIATLVKGMKIDDIITKLKGINCNGRGTSCPDQLAKALEKIRKNLD